eukprot:259809-Amphidinium_carterae.1
MSHSGKRNLLFVTCPTLWIEGLMPCSAACASLLVRPTAVPAVQHSAMQLPQKQCCVRSRSAWNACRCRSSFGSACSWFNSVHEQSLFNLVREPALLRSGWCQMLCLLLIDTHVFYTRGSASSNAGVACKSCPGAMHHGVCSCNALIATALCLLSCQPFKDRGDLPSNSAAPGSPPFPHLKCSCVWSRWFELSRANSALLGGLHA